MCLAKRKYGLIFVIMPQVYLFQKSILRMGKNWISFVFWRYVVSQSVTFDFFSRIYGVYLGPREGSVHAGTLLHPQHSQGRLRQAQVQDARRREHPIGYPGGVSDETANDRWKLRDFQRIAKQQLIGVLAFGQRDQQWNHSSNQQRGRLKKVVKCRQMW